MLVWILHDIFHDGVKRVIAIASVSIIGHSINHRSIITFSRDISLEEEEEGGGKKKKKNVPPPRREGSLLKSTWSMLVTSVVPLRICLYDQVDSSSSSSGQRIRCVCKLQISFYQSVSNLILFIPSVAIISIKMSILPSPVV